MRDRIKPDLKKSAVRRSAVIHVLRIVIAPVLLIVILHSNAAFAENIYIVSSKPSGPHMQVANGLKNQLSAVLPDRFKIRIFQLSGNSSPQLKAGKNDYIVTVGSLAFATVLAQKPEASLLATLIPRETYQALLQTHQRKPGNTTAVYIEQPVQRSLELIKIALPGKTPGVLVGHRSDALSYQLGRASKELNIPLYLKKMKPKENLVTALDQVLKNCDVLLAFADPEVSNPSTARHILLTSYRYGIPVVAYSRAYVRAGALMAVFSTPEEFAKQTTEILIQVVRSKEASLPDAQYPKYFSVDINSNVARSLGIELQSKSKIETQLKSIGRGDDE